MQWGPQKAFYNLFFPRRYGAKETPSKTDVVEQQGVTSIACSVMAAYSEFDYLPGRFRAPILETIAEEEECDEGSVCESPRGTRSTTSSPPLDSSYQDFTEGDSCNTQTHSPFSTGGNGIGESERLTMDQQMLGSTGAYSPFSPTSASSEFQDMTGDEDCQKLADIVGSSSRYRVLEEKIASEATMRVAIDTYSNTKVILMVYKSDVTQSHRELLQRFEECKHIPKVLNTVRVADGRSLLVLEYGNLTLSDWMKSNKHNLLSRKAVVSEILEAFVGLHSQGIRSGKVKPSLLMWYSSDQSWKFLGPHLTLEAVSKGSFSHSRRYAAPEILQNEAKHQSQVWNPQFSDMWTFGVIAFEILSGRRFHDPGARLEAVGKQLIGKKPLPSLSRIQEPAARRLLKRLLSLDPSERPTAKQTMENIYFRSRTVQDVRSARLTCVD